MGKEGFTEVTNIPVCRRLADNGGGHACVRAGSKRELSEPSFLFCYEPKTVVKKIKVFEIKKEKNHEITYLLIFVNI